uniref:Uncharacterized protein n=1 Tax=Nymphaea colorata TaxID=210225 RepID=A0A5K0XMF5_9MAGN
MTSRDEAPTWAEMWDTNDTAVTGKPKSKDHGSKMSEVNAKVKTVASVSMDKAKTAAAVGAQKVKTGTSVGIKWLKSQYEKRTSK